MPFAGGLLSATAGIMGDKEQQEFNEKIVNWASNSENDLSKVLTHLKNELSEPTKASLVLLLRDTLNATLPETYPVEGEMQIGVVLHNDTVNEFKRYEEKGYLTLIPNGSTVMNMGAGIKVGNCIEDLKRPYGTGIVFIITFHKKIYE